MHDRGQLSTAIRTVAAGGSVIDPKLVEVLVNARAAAERSPLRDLTARERAVLAEIAEGKLIRKQDFGPALLREFWATAAPSRR